MSRTDARERRGEANVATVLTWLVPGAGHLYLGRFVTAAVVFVVVEGLYALGWWLSEGRTFEFLDPELRGPMATILTPEIANVSALVAQMKLVGYGAAEPTPFPPHILLGATLTSISGLVNACAMCAANLAARSGDARRPAGIAPPLLVLAGWAVPGLGHFLQGRRLRALIVFVLLVGLFAWGTFLTDGTNLSRERHFYYWSGQFLLGLPAVLTEIVSGRPRVAHELPYVDVGLLYGCLAGLLNVLALLDVYGVAERRWLAGEPEPAAPPAPAEEPA